MIQKFAFSKWENVNVPDLKPCDTIRIFNKDGSRWVDDKGRNMWTVRSVVKTERGYRIYRYQ